MNQIAQTEKPQNKRYTLKRRITAEETKIKKYFI